jgi:uncharacterized protein YggT (Ycf19 family)
MRYTEPGDPREPYNTETEPAPRYYVEPEPPPRYYAEPEPTPVPPEPRVRYVENDARYAPSWRGWRASQIVYTIGGIVEVLILIRIVLELLAANPGAGFSSFIYTITDPLVAPFRGVFPTPQSHGNVLDLAAVLAIVVYALLTWAVARIVELIRRRSAPSV